MEKRRVHFETGLAVSDLSLIVLSHVSLNYTEGPHWDVQWRSDCSDTAILNLAE